MSLLKQIVIAIFCVVVASSICAALVVWNHARAPKDLIADRIVVEKSARKLSVLSHGKEIRTYRVALGAVPIGRKEEEGDMKTPEGVYTIDSRNRQSDFHLALHISYPGPEDETRAAGRGVSPGWDIEIHGQPNGEESIGASDRPHDWTAGCIALTDKEIEELWQLVPDGTPIEIRP
jgi:murein L,D-transpeptidase YafK